MNERIQSSNEPEKPVRGMQGTFTNLQNLLAIFYVISYNAIRDGVIRHRKYCSHTVCDEQMYDSKLLFAYRKRLINVRLENLMLKEITSAE